jgi:hypothetical protein
MRPSLEKVSNLLKEQWNDDRRIKLETTALFSKSEMWSLRKPNCCYFHSHQGQEFLPLVNLGFFFLSPKPKSHCTPWLLLSRAVMEATPSSTMSLFNCMTKPQSCFPQKFYDTWRSLDNSTHQAWGCWTTVMTAHRLTTMTSFIS